MDEQVHNITTMEDVESDESREAVEELLESARDILVKPFWKSTIIRYGIVIVAVKIVNITGQILIERARNKK